MWDVYKVKLIGESGKKFILLNKAEVAGVNTNDLKTQLKDTTSFYSEVYVGWWPVTKVSWISSCPGFRTKKIRFFITWFYLYWK